MLFYKMECIIGSKEWDSLYNDRRQFRQKRGELCEKTEKFNEKLGKKGFICISDINDCEMSLALLCHNNAKVEERFRKFINTMGFEIHAYRLEEITLLNFACMVADSSREGLINDDDDVLEKYGLGILTNRYRPAIHFGENLANEGVKKELYEKANNFLSSEALCEELDRIYEGGGDEFKLLGHPVHYIVATDDRDTRKSLYRILVSALSQNNRVKSRRYTFLDVEPNMRLDVAALDALYRSNIGGTIVLGYRANNDKDGEHASGDREIIDIFCERIKKYRNQVLTILCLPRECNGSKSMFFDSLPGLDFVEIKEEFVNGERAKEFLRMLAKQAGVRVDKTLYDGLKEEEGYLAPGLHLVFDEWLNNKLKTGYFPQYNGITSTTEQIAKAKPVGSAYDELMEMVGLDSAKHVIDQALDYAKAQKVFANRGIKQERLSMHMIFTGNPGTAKTSVARLVARILRENNILSKGTFVEVGRGDLVGKYVGWTAQIVQQKFKEAEGGVLFIDEAYSLVDDKDGLFGDEAINTIVQEMENHRDDVIVIFAGYPDKMEGFLRKNPGLRSRIAFHVNFDDYNTENLCDISRIIAEKKGLKLSEDAIEKLAIIFEDCRHEDDFGNGRFVRNIIERAKMAQASRLLRMEVDALSDEDIATICADDIEAPELGNKPVKRRIGFCE